jgi:hypothetical protein
MATKSHESKMLRQVRRWRKKAYEADKSKSPNERMRDGEKLARQFNLPLIQPQKIDPAG